MIHLTVAFVWKMSLGIVLRIMHVYINSYTYTYIYIYMNTGTHLCVSVKNILAPQWTCGIRESPGVCRQIQESLSPSRRRRRKNSQYPSPSSVSPQNTTDSGPQPTPKPTTPKPQIKG